jgi:hypothetical protein
MLTFRDPKWNVLGSNAAPGTKDMATILRNWMSWFMYHNDVREDVLEDFILDMLIAGTGVMEVGYMQPRPKKGNQGEQELADQFDMAAEAVAMQNDGMDVDLDALAVAAEQVGEELVPPPPEDDMERRTLDMPFVQHVDIWDFLVAPGYPRLEQAWVGGAWCAKRITMPLDKAKGNKDFSNRDQIESTREINSPRWSFLLGDDREAGEPEPIELAELWAYWEAPDPNSDKPGQVWIVSENSDKAHWHDDNPYPELNSFPFRALSFKKRKGRFYGIPYLQHLMEALDSFDLMRSFHQDIARFKKPVLGYNENFISEANFAAIANSPSGHGIGMQAFPNEAIMPINWGQASPELLTELQLLDNDLQIGSGLGPNQVGGFAGNASATEVSTVQQNILSDIEFIASKSNNLLAKVGRDVIKLLQSRGDPEREIRIAGTDGKQWIDFRVEDIKGDFDLRVGSGTEMPVDENVRQRMLIDVLQLSAAFPGQIRMNRLGNDIFELLNLPSPQDYFVDQEGREQNLETLGMLLTGQPTEVLPGDEHQRHRMDIARVLSVINEMVNSGEVAQDLVDNLMVLAQNLQGHDQVHAQFLGEEAGPGQVAQPQGQDNTGDLLSAVGGQGAGI